MSEQQQKHQASTELSNQCKNPLSKFLNISVSLPETIETRMVDASLLNDFKVWSFIASFLASAVIGFLVAYLQNNQNNSYLIMTLILAILFVISFSMTLTKNHKMKKKTKVVKFRASEIIN